jgi:hypothetical protein
MALLQAQIRITRTTIPLDFTRPVTPANRFQLLCTENQSNRDNDDGNQDFGDDILREGGGGGKAGVAEEHGVFVGGVATADRTAC